MASSAPAVVAPTSFDDLRLGRSAQFVVARLLRCWDSRNIKKQGEFLGITLLFLDEQVLFHLFTIKLFEKDQPFDSINFISSVLVTFFFTTSDEVLVNAPIINLQKFMLRKFEHLQALANTNLELPGLFLIYYSRNNFIQFKNCLNYGLRLRQYMCFTLQML